MERHSSHDTKNRNKHRRSNSHSRVDFEFQSNTAPQRAAPSKAPSMRKGNEEQYGLQEELRRLELSEQPGTSYQQAPAGWNQQHHPPQPQAPSQPSQAQAQAAQAQAAQAAHAQKSRLHRRTGSLETFQSYYQPNYGPNYYAPIGPPPAYHQRTPSNHMYSLPEETPTGMMGIPMLIQMPPGASPYPLPPMHPPHPPPPPGLPTTPRTSNTGVLPHSQPPIRPQPIIIGNYQTASNTLPPYSKSPVGPPGPPPAPPPHYSPRWVPSSPSGTPPTGHTWTHYPPHMALSPPPHGHVPGPPQYYQRDDGGGGFAEPGSAAAWGMQPGPGGMVAAAGPPMEAPSPSVRWRISVYTGGNFPAGKVRQGFYVGGECRLLEVSPWIRDVASLRLALFRGRPDLQASSSEPSVIRYHHPGLKKLVGIYSDAEVLTMFDEWRAWREDQDIPAKHRDPLHLYLTRAAETGGGAGGAGGAVPSTPSRRLDLRVDRDREFSPSPAPSEGSPAWPPEGGGGGSGSGPGSGQGSRRPPAVPNVPGSPVRSQRPRPLEVALSFGVKGPDFPGGTTASSTSPTPAAPGGTAQGDDPALQAAGGAGFGLPVSVAANAAPRPRSPAPQRTGTGPMPPPLPPPPQQAPAGGQLGTRESSGVLSPGGGGPPGGAGQHPPPLHLYPTAAAASPRGLHRRNSSAASVPPLTMDGVDIIRPEDLTRDLSLGEGSFGCVWRGAYQGHPVAIKCFFRGNGLDVTEAMEEARMLSQLRHPNVVISYGLVLPPGPDDFPETPETGALPPPASDAFGRIRGPALVTEYMEGGSLHRLLHNNYPLGPKLVVKLAADAANGMRYLHSRNIIHFDLKSANLLLQWETVRSVSMKVSILGPDGSMQDRNPVGKPRKLLNCKVADFGLSRFMAQSKNHVSLGPDGAPVGTVCWTAPEIYAARPGHSRKRSGVISREGSIDSEMVAPPAPPQNRHVSLKVDVYSFAIVMWEMWARRDPFSHLQDTNDLAVMFFVAKENGRPAIPGTDDWYECYGNETEAPAEPCPGWSELMQACWHPDPDRRPTFDVIYRRLKDALAMMPEEEA